MFCVVTMERPGNSTEEKTLTNRIPNFFSAFILVEEGGNTTEIPSKFPEISIF